MQNRDVIESLYVEFRQRCIEVKRYIEFVVNLTEFKATGLATENHGILNAIPNYEITRELTKTFRANGYLLLYNLVEATMTNAIDSIHTCIEADSLGFNDLSSEMKNISLSHFKRIIKDSHSAVLDQQAHPIEVAIARLGYEKHDIFSGNVDCNGIKQKAKQYGFLTPDPNRGGRDIAPKLRNIKDKRNALAHGRMSFEQCGHETSPESLADTAKQTMIYLRAVLWCVSYYLRQRQYSSEASSG